MDAVYRHRFAQDALYNHKALQLFLCGFDLLVFQAADG